jgi:O-antigen/teichoic acid export membrane protein
MKSNLKMDLFANMAGMAWSAGIQLICVPFYVRILGIEGYGLIGFYVLLLTLFQVLDLGISPTVNRELARASAHKNNNNEARDLIRTLEACSWGIGVCIGLLIVVSSSWIATMWIKPRGLSESVTTETVALMGMLAALQWPVSFYQNALVGLHRQVLANTLKIASVTLANGGALAVLWYVSPVIKSFFLWQVGTMALYVGALAVQVQRSLPQGDRQAHWDFRRLREISGFAAGMSGITASAMVLSNLDKLILSTLCSLEVFGYYTLAGVFGRALLLVTAPVFNTIFPRFSALVAAGDENGLRLLYHRSSQIAAVLLLPGAAVLALFSHEILLLWTGDPRMAANAAGIAAVLTIGNAINGLMNLPYALQLAHGWTAIGLRLNLLLLALFMPALWLLVPRFEGMGTAFAWTLLNCVYMAIGVPLTHRRLICGATWRWLSVDLGLAAAAVLAVVGLGRILLGALVPGTTTSILLLGLLALSVMASALAAPLVRAAFLSRLQKYLPAYG